MRLLQRLLRGPHERRGRHLQSCAECRLQQRRERQYLERLRGAEIPTASSDLTARLLARTEELARREPPPPPRPVARRLPLALRAAVLVTGGAAAAAALLGLSAYLMGGDDAPQAGGAPAPVFLQRDLSMSAAATVEEGAGTPAAWSLTGKPDFTPDGALTAAQLTTLRSQGWTCPELRELGYHLVWARAGVLAGGDILELRLTDGRDSATILEQHADVPRQSGTAGAGPQPAPAVPVNVLTGHPATSDGFTAAPDRRPAAGGPAGAGRGSLWINHDSPFAAIYQAGDATFTYVSDQPAEHAADAVAALLRSRPADAGGAGDGEAAKPGTADGPGTAGGPGTASGPGAPGGAGAGSDAGPNITVRLERGLGRIVELLAP
ncbi:anti-sigma factor [Arthrobacter sp. SO3]|uniref:anti-sigma factor n=1 Tax=Arthrobacter sp. SO3 TaxID=1897057 RepID=UPI001CFF9643|nr:anti-sigma factor [Arthrobacter sp. SO3]MCB5294820.1 hypothetical protein [Arthrobacter sp. SO3]